MESLRDALARLGLRGEFSLHAHLRSWPSSLRELIRITNLLPPDLNRLQRRKMHTYEADDAQGVTHGGDSIWFLSSKDEIRKFRISGPDAVHPDVFEELQSVELTTLAAKTDLEGDDLNVDHIGDLAFAHGVLFVPIRHATSPRELLVATDVDFNVIGYHRLPQGVSDSWCAYHDWTGFLYLPDSGDGSRWLAFDISAFVERLHDPGAWGRAVAMTPRSDRDYRLTDSAGRSTSLSGTQGIAFSATGRVYVTRTDFGPLGGFPFSNFIEVFSSLTGRRFSEESDGVREIDFGGVGDEIEGLQFHPSGVMYVAVAEHDVFDACDYELHVFHTDDRPL